MYLNLSILLSFFDQTAGGILVPQPGIKPGPLCIDSLES